MMSDSQRLLGGGEKSGAGPAFRRGLEFADAFYREVVAELIPVSYSACLLGEGSEVLGYDTARSTDHEWGPRVQIFVAEDHIEEIKRVIEAGRAIWRPRSPRVKRSLQVQATAMMKTP